MLWNCSYSGLGQDYSHSSLLAGTIHRYCVVDICALIMIAWSSDGVTEEDLMSTESELGCVHFDCPVDILYHLQSCL